MNISYVSSMFGLTMMGASFLLSGGLIAELTNANIYENTHKRSLVKAKKIDVNNDGLISLDELRSRYSQLSKNRSKDKNSQTDEAEFNARLLAMFKRMDSNSDGMLDDVEISKRKHRLHGKGQDSRGAT